MNAPRPRLVLALILGLYLVLGILFAANTPPWQAPDEPAHYNYVRYLAARQLPGAAHGRLPARLSGKDQEPSLSARSQHRPHPLRIPPATALLYLAAPIYGLTGGDRFSLRLFSVALGTEIVILAYAIARRALPPRPALALGTAAFVAFLPQHLATVAQIGNDVLAELLYAAALLVLVGWLTQPGNEQWTRHKTQAEQQRRTGALARPDPDHQNHGVCRAAPGSPAC